MNIVSRSRNAQGVATALVTALLTFFNASIVTAGNSPATGGQLAEAQARLSIAQGIVTSLQREADALGLSPAWRAATLNKLMIHSANDLRGIARAGGYAAVMKAADQKAIARKALGSTTQDLVYKPVTPCRFVDTRVVGGKVTGSRAFDLSQTGAAYGGDGGCSITTLAGVPDDQIGALAMNVTFFDTSTAVIPGFIGIRPAGSTNLTSVLNWNVSSPFAQDSNTTIVAMDQSSQTDEFEVFGSLGSWHVIIDMMGIFMAPAATALDCVTTDTGGIVVMPGSTFSVNAPACPATYTAVSGQFHNDTFINLPVLNNLFQQGGVYTCEGTNTGLTPLTLHCGARCCRVPGH